MIDLYKILCLSVALSFFISYFFLTSIWVCLGVYHPMQPLYMTFPCFYFLCSVFYYLLLTLNHASSLLCWIFIVFEVALGGSLRYEVRQRLALLTKLITPYWSLVGCYMSCVVIPFGGYVCAPPESHICGGACTHAGTATSVRIVPSTCVILPKKRKP